MTYRTVLAALSFALLSSAAWPQTALESNGKSTTMDEVKSATETFTGNPLSNADADMRHVIDAFSSLGPKPLPKLNAVDARKQPSVSDAASEVLREQGKSSLPDASVATKNILVDGSNGKIVATVYTPAGASGGQLPLIVYFHGGGFVIANNTTYDATPRMLAKQVKAVVVSVEYSKAPEHKFPASHDDALAAYKWVTQNAASIGGNPQKIAVVGESAGGNLAINVAIAARDQKLTLPVYEVIIYPMAGTNLDTPSYKEADSNSVMPLNKAMMEWFYANLTSSPADMQDPRLDIVGKADMHGLPPATVITDQIDPLRSEGLDLGARIKNAGVQVDIRDFIGVTHEFFGMGDVVAKAKEAETLVINNLKTAFATK